MSDEARALEIFRSDKDYYPFTKYFLNLRRKVLDFHRDSHHYSHMNKRNSVIAWLCDESGHHVNKFLLQIEEYSSIFQKLFAGELPDKREPIQQGKNEDHIFGTWLSNPENIDQEFVDASYIKFNEWKLSTQKGVLRKIDYILSKPFGGLCTSKKLNAKYVQFLKANRASLIEFNYSTSIRWLDQMK